MTSSSVLSVLLWGMVFRELETAVGLSVEQRGARRIEADADRIAVPQRLVRFDAEGKDLAAELGPHQRVGAHRIDDLDRRLGGEGHGPGGFAEGDVLGPDAEHAGLGGTAAAAFELIAAKLHRHAV